MPDKIRNSRSIGVITLTAVIAVVFSFMLYCNYHTSLLVDDYGYCFDFSTGWDSPDPDGLIPPAASERITSVFSIFGSMASHRECHSGRVLSHFLVQLFLMPSKDLFNVFNTIVFIVQAVFIYLCSTVLTGRKTMLGAAASILFTFMSLFMFQPVFGEINLWLDGSLNYLWTSTYTVIYIYFYLKYNCDKYRTHSHPVIIIGTELYGFRVTFGGSIVFIYREGIFRLLGLYADGSELLSYGLYPVGLLDPQSAYTGKDHLSEIKG